MNKTIHKTRACTIATLDEKLRDAIRRHGTEFDLQDLETDVLMCCETISAWQQKGFHGGIRTTLSVIYVTPIWLVWADGSQDQAALAGTAQLKHIDVSDPRSTAGYSISLDQGLNVRGLFTHANSAGNIFILLDSEREGHKFRQVLQEALLVSRRAGRFSPKSGSHGFALPARGGFLPLKIRTSRLH